MIPLDPEVLTALKGLQLLPLPYPARIGLGGWIRSLFAGARNEFAEMLERFSHVGIRFESCICFLQ